METSEIVTDEFLNKENKENQYEELQKPFDFPPLINNGFDLERRGSNDSNFSLRPSYKQKFKPSIARTLIQQILNQRLNNALYDKDQAPGWAHEISHEIKQKLIDLELTRYKYIVNVTIMENKCAGARIQCTCAWDMDTDNVAHETFKNDSIVCTIMAFGVCFY
ncbi:hypothetical protein RhiirA5_368820 [Rhizophagus irregularis]|uniref:Tctex-1 family-domain-containing protein n=3 Tax=Rhizophagus irregularis TaxID=588596 RepID=U9TCG3_RHIID|nr:Tctex-1 family-domain-containing protein [Rhizophagus irregularis DAOM 181602=DAOM 197198]EXX71997.1 hypothetical protein RirG_073470 [Rhizophagus irregularis DAOM 197198w]PKC17654.1 hypothetical protein RhiirA5_368820 [Rhizophagus irregularis]PKC63883.1 hypothetical protein RhiirA1_518151 [Rhizophagus irregularis]PKK76752.1 hypothetical protein RhiirC2_142120 [Rhizophagus irregularis]PKY27712.1 hypothetical protein RhiirB3_479060 [Rhizophagus irregularis]|eukprot:XP_025184314.1 Tctex-1 family-domain-containing protein [Rhizophagus irregularis DAOM 181602=DAOM 197198]